MYMMRGFGFMGWFGLIAQFLIGLLVLAVLVMLFIMLIRSLSRRYPGAAHMPPMPPVPPAAGVSSAKDIAQARYAKGEITREEYLQIVADLEK